MKKTSYVVAVVIVSLVVGALLGAVLSPYARLGNSIAIGLTVFNSFILLGVAFGKIKK